jgi:plastocyanin
MRFARLAVLALVTVALAACSSATDSSNGGHGNSITVSNNFFNPTPDTATAGVVTFTWSNASNTHNVTWTSAPGTLPANSATMSTGTFAPTLVQGTYNYHCTIHAGMTGTIVVL